MSLINTTLLSYPPEVCNEIFLKTDLKSLLKLKIAAHHNTKLLKEINSIIACHVLANNAMSYAELYKHKALSKQSPYKAFFSSITIYKSKNSNISALVEGVKELTLIDEKNLNFKKLSKTLESLTIIGKSSFNKDCLISLPQDLKALRMWNISSWLKSADMTLLPRQLSTLDLRFNTNLRRFDQFPDQLKVLYLDSNQNIQDEHIEFLPRGLTHISLMQGIHLTDAAAEKLPANLIHLNISLNSQLTDEFLKKMPNKIRRLILSGNDRVNPTESLLVTHSRIKFIHTKKGIAVYNSRTNKLNRIVKKAIPFQIKDHYTLKAKYNRYIFNNDEVIEEFIKQPVGALSRFYSTFSMTDAIQKIIYTCYTENGGLQTLGFDGLGEFFSNHVTNFQTYLGLQKLYQRTLQGQFDGIQLKRGLIIKNDRRVYGSFNDKNNLEGFGFEYQQSSIYFGSFTNGVRHGVGFLLDTYGSMQKLIYENGKVIKKKNAFCLIISDHIKHECFPENFTLYYHQPTELYFGTRIKDSYNQGVLIYNEDVYEGEFYNKKKCGHGVLFMKNGDRYEGEFSDDQMHGIGTYISEIGWSYTGSFVKGLRDGFGVITLKNMNVYEGYFKKDMFNGLGVLKLKDGSTIHYNFIKFYKYIMHRKAIIDFPNGNHYEGEVVEFDMHGKGVLTDAKGDIIHKGSFANNKPVKIEKKK